MRQNTVRRRTDLAGARRSIDVESEVSRLAQLSLHHLRVAWKQHFGTDPPGMRSADFLGRTIAWRLQEEAFGGLDAVTRRALRNIADAIENDGDYEPKTRRDLSPGVVLTREWKGVVHKVTATEDGFQHQGRHYKSLSDIARTITGTRWSGPRFFGLEQKKARLQRTTKS